MVKSIVHVDYAKGRNFSSHAGTIPVEVEAENLTEAREVAIQMVSCLGVLVTDARVVWTDDDVDWFGPDYDEDFAHDLMRELTFDDARDAEGRKV